MKPFSMRFVASLVLVAFLLLRAQLFAAGSGAAAPDCPSGAGAGAASIIAPMSDDGCEHSAPGSCLIVACGIAATALQAAPAVVVAAAGLMPGPVGPVEQFVDRYRTGPPTPPPNQV